MQCTDTASCLPLARDALRVTARRMPFGKRFVRRVYRHAHRDTFGDFPQGSLPDAVYREAVLRSSLRSGLMLVAMAGSLSYGALVDIVLAVAMPHQGVWGALVAGTLAYLIVVG